MKIAFIINAITNKGFVNLNTMAVKNHLLSDRYFGVSKALDFAEGLNFVGEFFGKTFIKHEHIDQKEGQSLKGRLVEVKDRPPSDHLLHNKAVRAVFAILAHMTIILPLVSFVIKLMHKEQIQALEKHESLDESISLIDPSAKHQEDETVPIDTPSSPVDTPSATIDASHDESPSGPVASMEEVPSSIREVPKTPDEQLQDKLSEIFEDEEIVRLIRGKFVSPQISSFTCDPQNHFEISALLSCSGIIGTIKPVFLKALQGGCLSLEKKITGTFDKKENESSFNFDSGCVKLSYSIMWTRQEFNLKSLTLRSGYPDGMKRFILTLQTTSDPSSVKVLEAKITTIVEIFKNFAWNP